MLRSRELSPWQRAGMEIETIPTTGSTLIPPARVKVHDRHLLYEWDEGADQREIPAPDSLLSQLIKLAEANDSAILAAARSWGPLSMSIPGLDVPKARRETSAELAEPVESWRRIAAAMRASLAVAGALRSGNEPPGKEWLTLGHFLGLTPWGQGAPPPPEQQQLALMEAVFQQLRIEPDSIWLCLRPDAKGMPTITLASDDVLGAALLQLLQAITGATAWGFCRGCSSPFLKTAQHRKWCSDCGRREQWRRASKQYYYGPRKGATHGQTPPR